MRENGERNEPGTGAVAGVRVVGFSGSHCCRSRSARCGEQWREKGAKTERKRTH